MKKQVGLLILAMMAAIPAWGQISNPSLVPWYSSTPPTVCVGPLPVWIIAPGYTGAGNIYGNTSTGSGTSCSLLGNGGTAGTVSLTSKADNTNYYCTFVGANTSTSQPMYVGPCTYNPSTNTTSMNTTGTATGLSGTPALPNGTTATTQSQADNSTKLATTAYVDTGLGGKQAALTNPVTWTSGYTGSVASATPTTLFTIPNPTVFAIYLVTATFDGYGNYGGFGATALVSAGNTSNAITTLTAGVNFSLGLSGNNVQVTIIYAPGSPIRWAYVKVMGY